VTWKNEKGLKPWLFKSVAVLIGICYLLAPLRQELTELMHFLSHSFDQGIGHHIMAAHSHNFKDYDWHDIDPSGALSHTSEIQKHMDSNEIGFHSHSHPPNSKPHTHEVIDFMSMAFSASTPSHQDNDGMKVHTDLDKHLVVIHFGTYQAIATFKKSHFSHIQENTSKGIQLLIVPPPEPLC